MISEDWITVIRPGDREIVGYLELQGGGFRPHDLLGHPVAELLDYDVAENLLLDAGLGYLVWRWTLQVPDAEAPIDVVNREISSRQVIVVSDDYHYHQPMGTEFILEIPDLSGRLQPGTPGSGPRFLQAVPN
ncbi:hypothetical protein [Psychromicrobium xiongbiense]|uniref:hypothetical protein n=1 Tax=Psychromicrobium xiongbiense TaxID=3051184 RepID=UPI002554D3B5|nr:hypothetical protein [Psychromicrobium sp. YIM S02556]